MRPELTGFSALSIAEAIRSGRLRAREVLDAHLARIHEVEPAVGAFLTLSEERAYRSASRVDQAVAEGSDPGPLAGIPIAVKDNIATRALRTTCASRFLESFRPVFDATAVRRIEEAGALVIGKTNLDEFGMGSSTEHSAFHPTRNPWDRTRVPGGSSGGSAAAVAAGMATAALGSDTGGSVRQPASFCGLVGLKPTYGAVSRYGLIAFASSFEGIGPIGHDARDCALLWNVLQGQDPRDATSLPTSSPIELERFEEPIGPLRLGIPRSWIDQDCAAEVRTCLDATAERFRTLGAEIVEVELPDPRQIVASYSVVATAEASSNLARYDGVRYGRRGPRSTTMHALYESSRGEGFGDEVKRRILLGTFVLSSGYYEAYYERAQRARVRLQQAFAQVLERIDSLLLPTAPTPAFSLGEKMTDPLQMVLSDIYTIGANLLAVPSVSFPAGLSPDGLPIGMQLVGRRGDEAGLLRTVRAHERIADRTGAARSDGGPATRSFAGG